MIITSGNKQFQTIAARIISVVFNPMLMPLYGLLVIFLSPTLFWYLPVRVKQILFFILLINNILVPLTLMPFFRYRPLFRSVDDDRKRERLSSLAVSSVLYLITSFILIRLQIPVFIKAYSISVSVLSIFMLAVSIRWDISLHSASAGALSALVLVLSLKMYSGIHWYLASAAIISGLVLSARLRLNVHNPPQVYSGFLSGFFILGLMLLLFQ